ncbi:MAG: HEAT repeat domain-containing protein [Planctomycetota bacterium]
MPILWLLLGALYLGPLPEDPTLDLRQFLSRYRTGVIDASVIGRLKPSVNPPAAFPAYERAREKLRKEPTVKGATALLEAATLRLHENPERELIRFAAQQPWVIRRRAIDELRRYFTDEEIQLWAEELLRDPETDVDRRRVLVEYLGAAQRRLPRDSARELLEESMRHPDAGVRAHAVGALGEWVRVDGLPTLLRALYDPEASVRLRAATALRSTVDRLGDEVDGERARLVPLMSHRLGDEDPMVRMLIAELIRDLPHGSAVPRLIEALADEESRAGTKDARLRFRVAVEDSLLKICGTGSLEWNAGQWHRWYESSGKETLEAGSIRGRTSDVALKRTYPGYFGREVPSDHVVFVMDFSGSMRRRPGTDAHDKGEGDRLFGSRIALARGHFKRYLEALDETHYFNVVIFAVGAQAAFDDLVPATRENRARAWAFVEQVKLGGETDLYAGLIKGLRTAGLDAEIRFATAADTLYLLSDGVPTAGAVTDPGDIVRTITKMNQASGLKINVVDLGARHKAFQVHLRDLALQNGGEYIRPEGNAER